MRCSEAESSCCIAYLLQVYLQTLLLRMDDLAKAKHREKQRFSKWAWTGQDSRSRQRDDVMLENRGFVDAIMEVIFTYDPFGETEISLEMWKKIGQVIK